MTTPASVLSRELFTLSGKQPANTDIKTYNAGNLYLCTSGFAADGVPCGVLTVHYDVELTVPITQNTVQAAIWAATGTDTTHLFGTDVNAPSGLLDIALDPTGQYVTFNQNFHGLLSMGLIGTVLALPLVTTGSTAVVSVNKAVTNTAATSGCIVCGIIADRGDIVQLSLTSATTVSSTAVWFTPTVNG
jgi:hypothetical protein